MSGISTTYKSTFAKCPDPRDTALRCWSLPRPDSLRRTVLRSALGEAGDGCNTLQHHHHGHFKSAQLRKRKYEKNEGSHLLLLHLPAVSKNDDLQQGLLFGRHLLYRVGCRKKVEPSSFHNRKHEGEKGREKESRRPLFFSLHEHMRLLFRHMTTERRKRRPTHTKVQRRSQEEEVYHVVERYG